jgi:hypothetical protein
MAVKTFTTGEVLTAADTNTYLNNGGLVYITQLSSTGTTLAIDNCFTTTYDSYRIVINQTTNGGTGTTLFRYRASGTAVTTNDYYYGGTVYFYNAVPSSWYGQDTKYPVLIQSGAYPCQAIIDLGLPRESVKKPFVCAASHGYNNYMGSTTHGYINLNPNTYDGFQLYQDAGNSLTATIRVYGYRKA